MADDSEKKTGSRKPPGAPSASSAKPRVSRGKATTPDPPPEQPAAEPDTEELERLRDRLVAKYHARR
jgi:hypothetical protein